MARFDQTTASPGATGSSVRTFRRSGVQASIKLPLRQVAAVALPLLGAELEVCGDQVGPERIDKRRVGLERAQGVQQAAWQRLGRAVRKVPGGDSRAGPRRDIVGNAVQSSGGGGGGEQIRVGRGVRETELDPGSVWDPDDVGAVVAAVRDQGRRPGGPGD